VKGERGGKQDLIDGFRKAAVNAATKHDPPRLGEEKPGGGTKATRSITFTTLPASRGKPATAQLIQKTAARGMVKGSQKQLGRRE